MPLRLYFVQIMERFIQFAELAGNDADADDATQALFSIVQKISSFKGESDFLHGLIELRQMLA